MNMEKANRLYQPKVIKEVMAKYGFRFSKGLGQNFLIDGNILDKIVEGSDIGAEDYVLEVGPGFGTLTQALCESAKQVVSVELDNRLETILADTLSEYDNFKLVHGDILKIDINQLIQEEFQGHRFKVAANLPYYITSPIVMMFLESGLPIDCITVMVQKEVADRMQAKPNTKDYGALSVAVQYYAKPEILAKVPAGMFMPAPNVDSAVISLKIYEEKPYQAKNEQLFFRVVKASFGQRRKTLLNALASGLSLPKDQIKDLLQRAEIQENRRGETLSIEEFIRIADLLED